jgi:GDP-4-dehydro-6-deoxy-D-mannose reductase
MTSKRVLITGVNGFVGKHMACNLLAESMDIYGIGRRKRTDLQDTSINYVSCDLMDKNKLFTLLKNVQFDYVIHLAGESNVIDSWKSPVKIMNTNVVGTLNLLESIRQTQASYVKAVLIISTSHEYEMDPLDSHVYTEHSPTHPSSPYGWSKKIATQLSQMYHELFGVPVIVARSFNLIAPGSLKGVCGQMATQIVEIEQGKRHPFIELGNPSVQRDFLDGRDAVTAYVSLLENYKTTVGQIFNVCRGQAVSIEFLTQLFQKYANRPFQIKINATLSQRNEPLISYGDSTKLRSAIGWKPNIPLDKTIEDLLTFARSRMKEVGSE